jgi:hypothetical protein
LIQSSDYKPHIERYEVFYEMKTRENNL